jgi:hypothetical protein
MKNVIVSLALAFATTFSVACATEAPKAEEPKEKIVCIDKMTKDGKVIIDKKTGKPAQDCRKMKIHKKLEGTKVPPAK